MWKFRAGWERGARALGACALAALWVACSDSSSTSRPSEDSGSVAAPTTSNVTLAWPVADGPVAGYAVYVQRDSGSFERELDVRGPTVIVGGSPGRRARVAVAAFDANGVVGPVSDPSPQFTFPGRESSASASASSGGSVASRSAAPADAVAPAASEAATEAAPEPAVAFGQSGNLLWLAGGAWRITDADLETAALGSAPDGARFLAADDFDGDGIADLLWELGGSLFYTASDDSESQRVDFGALETGERLITTGDFDGDGLADMLLLDSAGSLRSWLTAEESPGQPLGLQGDATSAGVGDFDGDGRDDLLWLHPDGTLGLWLLDGSGVAAAHDLVVGADLEVAGVGDFDGDGADELSLREPSGTLHVYEPLSGDAVAAGSTGAGVWRPVGAGDLDGDGVGRPAARRLRGAADRLPARRAAGGDPPRLALDPDRTPALRGGRPLTRARPRRPVLPRGRPDGTIHE